MNQLYLIIALLCSSSLFAQEVKKQRNTIQEVEFTEVVAVDSFPAAQLYLNSKLFLSKAFSGVREAAQIKDDKAKKVATKGSFPVIIKNAYGEEIKAKTYFTLIIQSRDGMYKYSLNDFYFAYTEETGITSYASFNDHLGVGMTKEQWKDVDNQTAVFVKMFIQHLKEEMLQKEVLAKDVSFAKAKN